MAYYVCKILNGQPYVVEKNDISVVRSLDFDFETGNISPVGTYSKEALQVGVTLGTTLTSTTSLGSNVLNVAAVGSFQIGSYAMVVLDGGKQYWASISNISGSQVFLARNLPIQASSGNQVVAEFDCQGSTDFTVVEDFKWQKMQSILDNTIHLRTTTINYNGYRFVPTDGLIADISSALTTERPVTNFKVMTDTGEDYTFTSEDDLIDLLYLLYGYVSDKINGEGALIDQIWDADNTQVAMSAITDTRTNSIPSLTVASAPVVRYENNGRDAINLSLNSIWRVRLSAATLTSSIGFFDQFGILRTTFQYNQTTGATELNPTTNRLGINAPVPVNILHVYENTTDTDTTNGVKIEQDGTGDSKLQFLLTGGQVFSLGIDNSDSDKFKITNNADLGASNILSIDPTTGKVEIPNLSATTSISRLAFSTTTSTSTLGVASVYACTDTAAARTLTISTTTIVLGTTTSVFKITVKDESGGAGTNNIIIVPETGTIDGQSSVVISADYGDITMYSDGTNLHVIGA